MRCQRGSSDWPRRRRGGYLPQPPQVLASLIANLWHDRGRLRQADHCGHPTQYLSPGSARPPAAFYDKPSSVLEQLVVHVVQLNEFLAIDDLLPDNQSAYRKLHSSITSHPSTQLLKNPLIHCYFIVSLMVSNAFILWICTV